MKFQHVIEEVYFKPWSITDAGFRDVHRVVSPHIRGESLPAHVQNFLSAHIKADTDDDCPDSDFFGQPIEQLQITPDGLAILPVFGPLINHASLMDRMCGACSYQQIQKDLLTSISTPGIKRIVLKIGSPGGMCNGMIETVRRIFQVREMGIPIKAISDTCVGSAAYALAAACDSIEITESTMIGSVGSFCAVLDSSKAYATAGLLVQVFKSGEMKGAGVDGTSLSKKQEEEFQARSDYYGEQFREVVRSTRNIDESLLQGQVFIGQKAIETGFADKIIEDIGDGCADCGDDDDCDY
jgi:ClpP class serine protease